MNEFKVHKLNADGLTRAARIAEIFEIALNACDAEGVDGRERALVVTKLQEACFFAKRSIAMKVENQE